MSMTCCHLLSFLSSFLSCCLLVCCVCMNQCRCDCDINSWNFSLKVWHCMPYVFQPQLIHCCFYCEGAQHIYSALCLDCTIYVDKNMVSWLLVKSLVDNAQMFHHGQRTVQRLNASARLVSDLELQLNRNMTSSVARSLQELSSTFRSTQSAYLKSMHNLVDLALLNSLAISEIWR